MKSLKIAGLCLASMLVMGMALAGVAQAAPLWLLCLEGSNANNTKYEDSSCTKAKSTGKWESVALGSKTDTIMVRVFSLKLRDKETPVGVSEVECSSSLPLDEGEGFIESNNKGKITSAKIKTSEVNTRCKRISGGCEPGKLEAVEGRNLPWNTEIFEKEGKFLTKIETSGAGNPGWAVKCKTLLGSKTDVCTSIAGEPEEVELINEVTGTILLVRGVFEKKHNAECTESSGKRAGQVEGLVAILLVNGNGLSINKT